MHQSNTQTLALTPAKVLNAILQRANWPGAIRLLMALQGGYYLACGIWPLIARRFKMATGPKRETWLVKTTGVLIGVMGSILMLGAWRQRLSAETILAGMGTAATMGGADVLYRAQKRMPRTYLLDALLQSVFLAGWGAALIGLKRKD